MPSNLNGFWNSYSNLHSGQSSTNHTIIEHHNGATSRFEMCFGPGTLDAGAKTRLESSIKKFQPHLNHVCFFSGDPRDGIEAAMILTHWSYDPINGEQATRGTASKPCSGTWRTTRTRLAQSCMQRVFNLESFVCWIRDVVNFYVYFNFFLLNAIAAALGEPHVRD